MCQASAVSQFWYNKLLHKLFFPDYSIYTEEKCCSEDFRETNRSLQHALEKNNNFLTHILEKAETGTHKERLGDFFFTAEPLESEIIRLGAERVSISIRC